MPNLFLSHLAVSLSLPNVRVQRLVDPGRVDTGDTADGPKEKTWQANREGHSKQWGYHGYSNVKSAIIVSDYEILSMISWDIMD